MHEHRNRWMLASVSLAIFAGLALGDVASGYAKAYSDIEGDGG